MAKKVSTKEEKMVKVRVLKSYPGHKKGDTFMVSERKVRDTAREVKRGLIKKV